MAGNTPEWMQRRLDMIAEMAEFLASRYADGRKLNVQEVIERQPEHKVTCSFESYGEEAFDGLIEYVPRTDGFHIHCNMDRCDKVNSGRTRFTLAHELGHYQIDEHRAWLKAHTDVLHPCFCFRSDSERKVMQEREADHFAAHFLLPTGWLKKDFGMPAPDGQLVIDVACKYRLSLQAAALRIVQVESIPCAMVVWAPNGRREWGWMSDRVFRTYFGLLKHGQRLPKECPTRQLLDSPRPAGEIIRDKTIAETWFPAAEEDQFTRDAGIQRERRDVIINEHAISLGRFGVMTFLCGNEWIRLLCAPSKGEAPRFWGFR